MLAALLAVSAVADSDNIGERKESIVRVALEKQGREPDVALLDSARQASAIVSLKLGGTPNASMLEIHTDGRPAYDWFFLDNETKLVVDFHDTINFESGNVLQAEGDPIVERVRTSLFALEPELVSRIVIDLKGDATPLFREVEKGIELQLARSGVTLDESPRDDASSVPAPDDSPRDEGPSVPALASQLLTELNTHKAAIESEIQRFETATLSAQADRPAVNLSPSPEEDSPTQRALRAFIEQEDTAGQEFWSAVSDRKLEALERIDTLKFRVNELQSSIEDGRVASKAGESAIRGLAEEIQKNASEDRETLAAIESELTANHARSQEEFLRLAAAASASPTLDPEPTISEATVMAALEGLSRRLTENNVLPEMPGEPEALESPTVIEPATEVITVAQEMMNNAMATVEGPVAFYLEPAGVEPPDSGMQLVTSVPIDLAVAQLQQHADAAATEPPDEPEPEASPEPSVETLEPMIEEAVAVEEQPAVPVETAPVETVQPDPVEEEAPAIESAPVVEAAPAAPPVVVVSQPEPAEEVIEQAVEVSRQSLPPGMDPLDQPVNIDFREMDLSAVVQLLARKAQINVIAGTDIIGTVTADIRNIPLRQAMDMVLRMNGLGMVEEEGIFRIVPYEDAVAARRTTRLVVLKDAQAEEVKTTLDGVLLGSPDAQLVSMSSNATTNVLIISGPEERVTEFEMLARQLDVSEPALPTVTEAIKLNYLEPEDAKPIAESLITEAIGKVESDVQGRHLVVTDMPVVVEQIRRVLQDVDKPVKQVAIEAMIVDAVMRDGSQTGVSWLLDAIRDHSSNGDLISDVSEAGFRTNLGVPFGADGLPNAGLLPAALDAGAITLGILTNDIRLNTVIAAEVQSRNAEILANPSIVTVENKPAEISIVQEFPYQEITQGLTGPPVATTEFKDIGVTLMVTPRVTHENDTIVDIQAKQSSVSGLTESGVPIEDLREAHTTLRAEDGRTIFIGGLRNVSDTHTVSKVPVLGDIPLLNIAFKNTNVEKVNTELLIFLTCRVLQDPMNDLTPSHQREYDKLDATPEVPDSQRKALKDYVKPQEMRDPIWKWRRSVH
jgi:type IV pilus secretin PilQ/predicted competence protein